jgi:hypothetical protein
MRQIRARVRRSRLASERGQSMIEMAMVSPFIVVLVLGLIELSWGLLDQHIVTKLSREGSNLISRDSTLDEAAAAMRAMSTGPIDFSSRSKATFSVIKWLDMPGAANDNTIVMYQRFSFGSAPGTSRFSCSCSQSDFGSGPDYIGTTWSTNAKYRVTGVPAGALTKGSSLYVTEIWTQHDLITPFNRFGFSVPTSLYSIAYF